MGSSSNRTPEQIKEQDKKDQEEYNKTHEVMNIQGGMHNTNRIPGGGQVETYTVRGRRGFEAGGTTYYENKENGRWESNTRTADYYNLGSVASQEAASGGGGGKKKKKPKPPKKDPPVTYPGDPGPTVQTTPESAFNVGSGWSNWSPPGGGTGNPLWDQYDPWMPDPALGIWTNPGIINTNPKVLI